MLASVKPISQVEIVRNGAQRLPQPVAVVVPDHERALDHVEVGFAQGNQTAIGGHRFFDQTDPDVRILVDDKKAAGIVPGQVGDALFRRIT